MTKIDAKVLFLDIETAPNLCFTWGVHEQNISYDQIVREGYILMVGYRWLGQKRTKLISIHDYPHYKKDPHSDKALAQPLYDLLDEADIVVAHNGNRFDIKHINTLFLKHIGHPPSAYKKIDTLLSSRANFYQNTHKLDHQCRRHIGAHKEDTGGFELWRDIYLKGCQKSFAKMVKYCKKDVDLLHDFYLKIRPFISNHPSVTIGRVDHVLCPRCGSANWHDDGIAKDRLNWRKRAKCKDCHRRFRYGGNIMPSNARSNLTY